MSKACVLRVILPTVDSAFMLFKAMQKGYENRPGREPIPHLVSKNQALQVL